jgi:hypothetical protein
MVTCVHSMNLRLLTPCSSHNDYFILESPNRVDETIRTIKGGRLLLVLYQQWEGHFLRVLAVEGDPVGERTVDVAKVRSSTHLVVANIYV